MPRPPSHCSPAHVRGTLRSATPSPATRFPVNSPRLDLLQGTVDVLVLRTLAWGPMHGYAIATWIRDRTDGELDLEDAALYRALHRLEKQSFVAAEWGLSENNRRARYYQLTPAGEKHLRAQSQTWRRYAAAVFKVLDPAAG
jgi:PadR family transcriptional regulator, regulatory protein PadR